MVPEGWKAEKLADLADVQRGKFSARPRNDPRFFGGDIPFVQTGDVSKSSIKLSGYSQTLNEDGLAVSKLFPAGTILMTIAANIGDVALTEYPVACPDSVVGINAHSQKADRLWLLNCLTLEKGDLDRNAPQMAQKNINLEVLKPLELLTPPIEEQRKIADILSAWDRAIETTEALLAAARTQKRALMQTLLTGKRRFPEFEGQEWRSVKLGEVFEERSERGGDELPLLAITGGRGVIPQSETDRRDTSRDDKSSYKQIHVGDIGYNSMRMWQGVSALSGLTGLVSPAYTIVKAKPDIDGRFAAHLFRLPRQIHLFRRYSQGLTSDTWNLKFKQFAEVPSRCRFL